MTLEQIAKKYGVSDSIFNSKDDAILIAAASILDLKGMVTSNQPREVVANKLQFLADFLTDVKNSNY
jgi:hypothetical protein